MMDDDDDDDYFFVLPSFSSPSMLYEALCKKLSFVCWVRVEWMYVCSVALGLEWLRIIMSFCGNFPYMFSREDVHRDLREREKQRNFSTRISSVD